MDQLTQSNNEELSEIQKIVLVNNRDNLDDLMDDTAIGGVVIVDDGDYGEIKERQDNEICALKSIYQENLVDLRQTDVVVTAAGNTPIPLHQQQHQKTQFKITLRPHNSESQVDLNSCEAKQQCYVQIEIKVEFTRNYPNELPKFRLENAKGLSIDQVRRLYRKLVEKANQCAGREMIYDLCQDIQDFLYLHNKPPSKSFHEQMLDNQRLNELADQQQTFFMNDFDDKRKIEEKTLAEIDQAILAKQRMIKEEIKKERQMNKRERLSSSNYSPTRQPKPPSSKNNSESELYDMSQIHFNPFNIEFTEPTKRTINCIKPIRYDKEHSFRIYRAIDTYTHDMVYVYEWCVSLEKNKIYEKKKFDLCITDIGKIEEELRKLIKLSNDSIIKYMAYKHYKQSEKHNFIIQICLNYTEGNTLEIFLKQHHAVCYSTLKCYTIELLNILEYLHQNHVYHRDLKASCIYLGCNGNLKLSDYSIVKRINNLYEAVVNEATNFTICNAKSDIHQLGLLLLSLALGEQINDYYPKIPNHLPSELRNFITMCMYDKEKLDFSQLRNHKFLISVKGDQTNNSVNSNDADHDGDVGGMDNGDGINNKKRNGNGGAGGGNVDTDGDYIIDTFTDYSVKSRLSTEFEVIGLVGRGAFGEVLKAQNKIDMRYYAIKRIRINPKSTQLNKQITREIKLLSRLNHENVVRYYSTWIERYEEEEDDEAEDTETATSVSVHHNHSMAPSTANTSYIVAKQQQQKQHIIKSTKITKINSNKKLTISSSFSDLLLKDTNLNENFMGFANCETGCTVGDDDDDGFSMSFSSSSDKTSSSTSSSSSSSSSSDEDVDGKERKKNGVVFSLSPKTKKKPIGKNAKNIDDSDSVVFECEANDGEEEEEEDEDGDESVDKVIKKPLQKTSTIDDEKIEEANKSKQTEITAKRTIFRQFIYIQMEYCNGKTLKDLIDKNLYQDVDRVWSLFREILQGLNHIHEQGMIHRDLKPRNVLIDNNGHAKIGDFGLATSKFLIQSDSQQAQQVQQQQSATTVQSTTSNQQIQQFINTSTASHQSTAQLDSTSMSGAVGTALYVAPELLKPSGINKYSYTQKVDIYSLGIMFYEMCFTFQTYMERVCVLQNLRKQEIVFPGDLKVDNKDSQIDLIKKMLNHDPNQRPSAKELLRSECVPRNSNEIALDELLRYSLSNKNSTNYSKILKTLFDQINSKSDDVSYDTQNCKQASSFRYLQIREHVHNTLTRLFQKNGAYMLSYPLLMPWNADICSDFNKSFQLIDSSGLVLTLPYNHRLQFARYIARSGYNDIKRYFIGNVYQVYSEKFKLIGLHPKENCEASFDIVTSTNGDCLPECEILYLLNEIIQSLPELMDHEFKLIINHSFILNSILLYCGIKQDDKNMKSIYFLLAEYNKITNKSQDFSKEARTNWLKERLNNLGLNEHTINKLLNCLMKYGDLQTVLSELRILTKNESNISKMAKEGIRQLKVISQLINVFDLKFKYYLSTSFVLPLITHPFEYNGFIFQLLIKKRKKKNEFDILASGGRYDKLINYFCTKDFLKQFAIGVSIDFDRIVTIINEKSAAAAPQVYKQELALFLRSGSSTQQQPHQQVATSATTLGQLVSDPQATVNIENIKDLFCLYKYLTKITRPLPVCTHLVHERLATLDDMDDYCKKYSINGYVLFKDENIRKLLSDQAASDDQVFFKIRTLLNDKARINEKRYNLTLLNKNSVTHTITPPPQQLDGYFDALLTMQPTQLQASTSSSSQDLVKQPQQLQQAIREQSSNTTFTQLNTILLLEPYSSSSSSSLNAVLLGGGSSGSGGSSINLTRKKLETQILTRIQASLQLFSNKTRIDLIALDMQDIVIHTLANHIRLDADEQTLHSSWQLCLEKFNLKLRKQLCNFKLDDLLHDLKFVKRSRVFIFYSIKNDAFRILVTP